MSFFFFNDTATTEIYTLSLHDALPIYREVHLPWHGDLVADVPAFAVLEPGRPLGFDAVPLRLDPHLAEDRKSTRLNSSHANISYAVFCLKKKQTSHSALVPCVVTYTQS